MADQRIRRSDLKPKKNLSAKALLAQAEKNARLHRVKLDRERKLAEGQVRDYH